MNLHNWLRIIILFHMDKFFKISFEFPHLADILFPANNDFVNSTLSQIEIGESTQFYKAIFLSAIKIILSCLILCLLSRGFVLSGRYLRVITNFRINNLFVNVVEGLEMEWDRLNISCVLRMFWALRVIEQILYLLTDKEMQDETFFGVVKNVLIKGSVTFTAVLGMTSFVSYFCYHIVAFFQRVLLTDDVDEKIIGTISAVLFYIIALQTGPTGLEERIINSYCAFCLCCAALLHHIHFEVNPLLISLSVSYNSSLIKHITALLICGFLIVFPITMLAYFWSHHSVSTWLLAVSFFSIQIIIKLLVSLAVYSLFLIDAYRTTFWEKLDDYVYYIKSFGNTVEFFLSIFLFLYGVYIRAFVSGGAVHAFMLCINAYFNIWCGARDGWRVFIKRYKAMKKIESLPAATTVQLSNLDDVCAICYQNMGSAKITKCNHYFHGVCLRKWLYVKDRCPLCRDILFKAET